MPSWSATYFWGRCLVYLLAVSRRSSELACSAYGQVKLLTCWNMLWFCGRNDTGWAVCLWLPSVLRGLKGTSVTWWWPYIEIFTYREIQKIYIFVCIYIYSLKRSSLYSYTAPFNMMEVPRASFLFSRGSISSPCKYITLNYAHFLSHFESLITSQFS